LSFSRHSARARGAEKAPSQATPGKEQPSASAAAPSVKPTGRVITVELYSDEKGNYFKPAKLEAHRGDLIRFTLKSGVHNVHFLPDSNPGAQGLPPASEFLQLPESDVGLRRQLRARATTTFSAILMRCSA
jgi:plastocyanin